MINALPTGRAGQALAVSLLLALLGVAWLAVASPLIGWYSERAANMADRVMVARHLAALASQAPALDRVAQRIAAARPSRDTLLKGSTNAIAGADLQQIVQALATRNGAQLSSAETLPPQQDGGYWRIRLRVSVTGTWPVLVHLLQAATTGQPVMLVDDLHLRGSDLRVHPASVPFNAQFTLIAFRAGTVHPAPEEPGTRSVASQ